MSKFLVDKRLFARPISPFGLNGAKRGAGDMLPPSQYDTPYPKKLNLFYAMRKHWEINPLIFVTTIALSLPVWATAWALRNKVDFSFTRKREDTISRTMDLRRPTVHKIIIINQEYKPWPEMQDVLDRMAEAEKLTKARKGSCA